MKIWSNCGLSMNHWFVLVLVEFSALYWTTSYNELSWLVEPDRKVNWEIRRILQWQGAIKDSKRSRLGKVQQTLQRRRKLFSFGYQPDSWSTLLCASVCTNMRTFRLLCKRVQIASLCCRIMLSLYKYKYIVVLSSSVCDSLGIVQAEESPQMTRGSSLWNTDRVCGILRDRSLLSTKLFLEVVSSFLQSVASQLPVKRFFPPLTNAIDRRRGQYS